VTASLYSNLLRLVWRDHASGPGVATFEYSDGGHDHREMSRYQLTALAEGLGFKAVQQGPDLQEWVRPS
jgi:hypothetical protein